MSSPEKLRSPTPFSSPANTQDGTSPQQLTPRSKVKAMLAAIDDESDSDASPKGADTHAKSLALSPLEKENASGSSHQETIESEDDAEDEERNIGHAKPRGKLAARLQGHVTAKDGSGVDEEQASAYERIRIQLLSGPRKESETLSENRLTNELEDDDDGPLETAPRRIRRAAIDSDDSRSTPKCRTASKRPSQGLFLSLSAASSPKQSSDRHGSNGWDSDIPPDPQVTSKVLQLVARKKAEREAKEAKEARKKSIPHQKPHSKKSSLSSQPASSGVSEDEVVDIEGERRLAQHVRPTRKASKKALEEMNRETQRMSRNMQLAHQAKTKKKITKESLFARFNFKTSNASTEGSVQALSSSTAPNSSPVSEFEGRGEVESPPSSPPQSTGATEAYKDITNLPELSQMTVMNALNFGRGASGNDIPIAHMEDDEEDLPAIFEIVNPFEASFDKGKGRAIDESIYHTASERTSENPKRPTLLKANIHVQSHQSRRTMDMDHDSDSDLEILPNKTSKTSKADIFDRLPATKPSEGRPLQTLRVLAHLTSPSKQNSRSKASMSLSEMQASLQRRARQQAALERAEKIQDLKDRGIIVQTAEERERDQVEVEDLVEKARREAEEIMQKEKNAARKEKKKNGEDDALPDTSDEDEDYQDSEADESNIELSGSEEEELVEEHQDDDSKMDSEAAEEGAEEGEDSAAKDQSRLGKFINTDASEACDEEEIGAHANVEDNYDELGDQPFQRRRRTNHIIEEDEDEDEDENDNAGKKSPEAIIPVQIPLIPGPHMSGDPSIGIMGMTQAFAATMGESQTQAIDENSNEDQEQDSLCFLGPVPEPDFPLFDLGESQRLVPDSQSGEAQGHIEAPLAEVELHFSQSQAPEVTMKDTQNLPPTATQYSDIPDPTQDVGFALSSPGPEQRFASIPPSTVDTVVLSRATGQETPKVIRKGRLRRRVIPTVDEYDSEKADREKAKENAGFQISANAFNVLKKSKGKPAPQLDSFDKKMSEAKEMVEDQAQESEDEYAGLGGASGDESDGSEDEEVRKMIEEGEVNVNESELAAFYADKERATDSKAVEKLFKDINNGLLRRKRGAEFDLSDSEDDAEARHRAKRREFARMRKALLENENVGKIAEDPKKLAFLRAIEDRDDDEGLAFLDDDVAGEDSQQQLPDTQTQDIILNSQLSPSLPSLQTARKRKRPALEPAPANRPPAAARRTAKPAKKPSTLAEIRESVSFLIEDSNIAPLAALDSSDIEEGGEGTNPRRTSTDKKPVVDRISLAHASSSLSSVGNNGRLAFQAPASANAPGFKVPSLLRRATNSSSLKANEDRHGISTTTAATERAAGGEKGDFIRKGRGKRSSVMSFAREVERRKVLDNVERRREAGREKVRGAAKGLAALVPQDSWD